MEIAAQPPKAEMNPIIERFLDVLKGDCRWPLNFFAVQSRRYERICVVTMYLLEHILRISPEEAMEKLTVETLEQYKLGEMLPFLPRYLEQTRDTLPKDLVRYVYGIPEPSLEERAVKTFQEVLSGKRKRFPTNYFYGYDGQDRMSVIIRYLANEILHMTKEDLIAQLTPNLLKQYKLDILLNLHYPDLRSIIRTAYSY